MKVKVLFALLVAIVHFGCLRDNLNQPTTTNFGFKVESQEPEFITITEGSVLISEIGFKGKRSKGAQVQFVDYYTKAKKVEFNNQSKNQFSYEIPQGNYTDIELSLTISKSAKEQEESLVVLQLKGQYKTNNGEKIPLQVDFREMQKITKKAVSTRKDSNIVLYALEVTQVDIRINSNKLFKTIDRFRLENANRTVKNEKEQIVIDETNNENIFKELVKNIDSSVQVIFNLAK
jgi:hypothetical protein